MMTGRALLAVTLCVLVAAAAVAADRQWQSAIWRDTKIERPKVITGTKFRHHVARRRMKPGHAFN